MIFSSQLEVDESDRDKRCDHEQHDEGQDEYTKEGVNFMAPDGVEYVVQLDVDGRKGQKASQKCLHDRVLKTWAVFGNLTSWRKMVMNENAVITFHATTTHLVECTDRLIAKTRECSSRFVSGGIIYLASSIWATVSDPPNTGLLDTPSLLPTSRATFFVRQGASKSPAELRPAIPPTTLKGKETKMKRPRMMKTVAAGKAAVEALLQATELRNDQTRARGPGNTSAAVIIFQVQFFPPICR